jgi:putative membrane protein
METIDLLLAIFHHILIFALAAVIAIEIVLIRNEMSHMTIGRLASIDRVYGLVALFIIIVGVARVFYGLKGWEFYVYSWTFWAKMAAFAAVGLLSILPTVRFLSWKRRATGDTGFSVPEAELASVRTYLRAEMTIFILIPIFAAAMARGYGYFG